MCKTKWSYKEIHFPWCRVKTLKIQKKLQKILAETVNLYRLRILWSFIMTLNDILYMMIGALSKSVKHNLLGKFL